jgi:hypothetical protein
VSTESHTFLSANLVVHGRVKHMQTLCSCGWVGHLEDDKGTEPFGAGLQMLARMQNAWDVHMGNVVQVTAA